MKRRNLSGKKRDNYSFLHTQQRMRERHGLILTSEDYDRLNARAKVAKDHREEICEEDTGGTVQRIFLLGFHGMKPFVWEDRRACITTVLKEAKACAQPSKSS